MYGIKDPNALLRPFKDLRHFQEEFYAMFTEGPSDQTPIASTPGAPPSTEPAPRRQSVDQGSDINFARKTRLEVARAASPIPDSPPRRDSHASQARTAAPEPETARRAAPAAQPTPAAPELGPQPEAKLRVQSTTEQIRVTPAPEADHSSTRRVSEPIDASAETQLPGFQPERAARQDRPVGAVPVQEAADVDHGSTRRSTYQTDNSAVIPTLPPTDTAKPKEWGRRRETIIERSTFAEPVKPRDRNPLKSEEREGRRPPKLKTPEGKAPRESEDQNLGFVPLDIGEFANQVGGGGGGTTVFIGQVGSDSTGSSAGVLLYPDGPTGDPGDMVEVEFPGVDPTETIPAGMWVYSIFEFTDSSGDNVYYANPPTWLS